MKKNWWMMVLFGLALAIGSVQSQTIYSFNSPVAVSAKGQFYEVVSDTGSSDAENLLRELELRFEAYNRLFRFNTHNLTTPLRVRTFANKAAYDSYVQKALGVVREGAVYLHYGLPENRELVISRGSEAERVVLPYQAFHQYLRAFVPYPPRWMLEGFGIYFGKLLYDDTSRELAYEENLSWLETVKTLGNAASPVESILLADLPGRGATRDFQPMAWALVSFFLNSGGNTDYFRTLSEAFMLLLPNYSAGDNAQIVYEHLFKWVDVRTLQADFTTYTQSRMTLADLINAGQRAYSVRNFVDAEYYFTEALYQKPATNAAYYYLGIIAYDNGKYDVAEQYYQSALRYGADPGMVYYALGLNAATSGQNDNAVHFLNLAKTASPARFGERVDSIIARIR